MLASLLSVLALWSVAAADTDLLILFDASYSGVLGAKVGETLTDAWPILRTAFPDARIGVASFVDKPAPYVGLGTYGGFPNGRRTDWCYRLETELSADDEVVQQALYDIPMGSGMDRWEGHFEALVRGALDTNMGWKEDARRVILLVTDEFGHSGELDTLAEHVVLFNTPVSCWRPDNYSIGGYGAQTTHRELSNWVTTDFDTAGDFQLYKEMADLQYTHMCTETDLAAEDLARLAELREKLGPIEVPQTLPFDRALLERDPTTHCRQNEYPTYAQTAAILAETRTELIVLQIDVNGAASPDAEGAWTWTLANPMSSVTSQYRHVDSISSLTLAEAISSAAEALRS